MDKFEPAQEFVTEYKELFGKLGKFEQERDDGLKDIRKECQEEVERIQNVIYELENEIDAIQDKCEETCGLFFNDINERKIEPVRGKLFEMNKIFNVVAGRATKPVFELTEDDFEIRNRYNREIVFYDEFYDDNCLSLRAVILGYSPMMLTNGAEVINIVNSYKLCIVGLAENEKYFFNYTHTPELECLKGELHENVFVCLVKSPDLEEVKKYYAMHVKGNVPLPFESDIWNENDFNKMSHFEEFLQSMVAREHNLHDYNESLKAEFNIKDFEDIIAYHCPDCSEYYSIYSVKNSPAFRHFLCPKCDERLEKFEGF